MKGFSRNSPQKVHPNFAENLGREILGNTFSGLEKIWSWNMQTLDRPHSMGAKMIAHIFIIW